MAEKPKNADRAALIVTGLGGAPALAKGQKGGLYCPDPTNAAQRKKLCRAAEKTACYGLTLTEGQASLLLERLSVARTEQRRVLLDDRLLPRIMHAFADSDYADPRSWTDQLARLADLFLEYKNDSEELATDSELLKAMRHLFDSPCRGDLEQLATTCLPQWADAVRDEGSADLPDEVWEELDPETALRRRDTEDAFARLTEDGYDDD